MVEFSVSLENSNFSKQESNRIVLFADLRDPRFELKKTSIKAYSKGYSKYCERKWREAKEIFLKIHKKYALGIGTVMAKRCDTFALSPPSPEWNGIWRQEDK